MDVPTEPSDVCCWGKTGRIADAPLLPLVTLYGHQFQREQTPAPVDDRPRRRRSLTLRSHCPVGDARLNKVLGCFGPRVETDLPEHFAVLLGDHVVVPKGAKSSNKVGCDGLDRCGQFVEQCSRLQVSTVLWVLGSFGAPPVGGLLKVQSQRFPYFVIGHFVPRPVYLPQPVLDPLMITS